MWYSRRNISCMQSYSINEMVEVNIFIICEIVLPQPLLYKLPFFFAVELGIYDPSSYDARTHAGHAAKENLVQLAGLMDMLVGKESQLKENKSKLPI